MRVAERMIANVAKLKLKHEYSDTSDIVTVSLGVSCCEPSPDKPAESLILAADEALYEAKETGRNKAMAKEFKA